MVEWITAKEAADILGVHRSAVPKMIKRGDLARRPKRRPSLNRTEVLIYRDARFAARRASESARNRPQDPWQPTPPDREHDWLVAQQAANIMGISAIALSARARRGQLPSTKSDGRRWYRRDLLEMAKRAHEARRRRVP